MLGHIPRICGLFPFIDAECPGDDIGDQAPVDDICPTASNSVLEWPGDTRCQSPSADE